MGGSSSGRRADGAEQGKERSTPPLAGPSVPAERTGPPGRGGNSPPTGRGRLLSAKGRIVLLPGEEEPAVRTTEPSSAWGDDQLGPPEMAAVRPKAAATAWAGSQQMPSRRMGTASRGMSPAQSAVWGLSTALRAGTHRMGPLSRTWRASVRPTKRSARFKAEAGNVLPLCLPDMDEAVAPAALGEPAVVVVSSKWALRLAVLMSVGQAGGLVLRRSPAAE